MNQYRIKKGFIVQKMSKKYVLFDPETSTLHTINETGAFIFSSLKKKMTYQDISQKIATRYKIALEKAQQDTSTFIDLLKKKGIISTSK
ncbi:PqqD family protein [Candidatus Roizmanbacteria bacterium]|nr:PqqD family protein [Candidatus Roizmanbacteria bacterium]